MEAEIKVIAEKLVVDVSEVVPAAKLDEDLGADSLDKVELIMALEQRYDVRIPDADAKKLLTVQDVLDYVQQIKAKKAGEARCETPVSSPTNVSA